MKKMVEILSKTRAYPVVTPARLEAPLAGRNRDKNRYSSRRRLSKSGTPAPLPA
jgi:hypothetical protein